MSSNPTFRRSDWGVLKEGKGKGGVQIESGKCRLNKGLGSVSLLAITKVRILVFPQKLGDRL